MGGLGEVAGVCLNLILLVYARGRGNNCNNGSPACDDITLLVRLLWLRDQALSRYSVLMDVAGMQRGHSAVQSNRKSRSALFSTVTQLAEVVGRCLCSHACLRNWPPGLAINYALLFLLCP